MRFCNEVMQGFGAELEVGTSRRVKVWWGRLIGRGIGVVTVAAAAATVRRVAVVHGW